MVPATGSRFKTYKHSYDYLLPYALQPGLHE